MYIYIYIYIHMVCPPFPPHRRSPQSSHPASPSLVPVLPPHPHPTPLHLPQSTSPHPTSLAGPCLTPSRRTHAPSHVHTLARSPGEESCVCRRGCANLC